MRQLLWLLVAALLVFGGWQFLLALRAGRGGEGASRSAARGRDGKSDATSRPEPVVPADPFVVELELQRLRREVESLRVAFERQQGEIAALRGELEQRAAQSGPDEAAPGASPEYSEALALARRGLAVDEIAGRCGITRAEAELVAALAAGGRSGTRGDLL